jgi:RHS repeat-associated protein
MDFDLGWYDYGARFYDPTIARWGSIDGLAEIYYPNSPYHFVNNNPINNFDIDGNRFSNYLSLGGAMEWIGRGEEQFAADIANGGDGAVRAGPEKNSNVCVPIKEKKSPKPSTPPEYTEEQWKNDLAWMEFISQQEKEANKAYNANMRRGEDPQGQGGNNPIEYVGAVNDIALATAMGYNALDNGLKRKYAYQLSKHINAKPGNIYQSTKSFGKSSAKVLGKTASVVAVGSIAYDFGTGTANTATLVDAGMLIGGAATVAILGTVAAPFVVGAGVVYGVGCLFGFDDYLNETLDISKSINFINP